MFIFDLIVALILGLIFAVLIAGLVGWRHPSEPGAGAGGAILFAFLIIFLATWAGGVWLQPYGPLVGGTPWVAFLLVSLLIALILVAVAAPPPRDVRAEPAEVTRKAAAFSGFFWALVVVLILLIIFGYLV